MNDLPVLNTQRVRERLDVADRTIASTSADLSGEELLAQLVMKVSFELIFFFECDEFPI